MSTTKVDALHHYDSLFYRYQREGSARSAMKVLPNVLQKLRISSALDVGCGAAAWLSAYDKLGVRVLHRGGPRPDPCCPALRPYRWR